MASSADAKRAAHSLDREAAVRAVTKLFSRKVGRLSAGALIRVKTALEREDAEALVRELAGREVRGANDLGGEGIGDLVSLNQGRAAIEAVTVDEESTDWAGSELLGAGEAALRLDIARTTLDNWRRAGKAIAFRKGVRNYVYPMRQFGRMGPLDGLDRVTAYFATPEDAWEWLVTPNRQTADAAPIDRLRQGFVNEVLAAAEGALDYA